MDNTQTTRFLDMLTWLGEHPAERSALTREDMLDGRDVLEILEKLDTAGFYEWIPILLLHAEADRAVDSALAVYLVGKIKEAIENKGIAQELSVFQSLLRREVAKRTTT